MSTGSTEQPGADPQSAIRNPQSADAALYRVASMVGRSDDPGEALTAILEVLTTTFGASSGSISLLNPDSGKLEVEVHRGMPSETCDLALRPGQGITGWVAFHGRAQLVPDVTVDPRYIVVRPDVKSEMAAPMLERGGQILGVINLDSDRVGGFSNEDFDLFLRVTDEATSVIRRLWQLQQLSGKARQFESLVAAGQALVTKLDPDGLFENIARDARKITQAHACALYLCDGPPGTVRMACLDTRGPAEEPSEPMPRDSCLFSAAIHTRRQVEYANVRSPDFFDVVDLPHDPALRSVLATPLIYEKEVIGVLAVFTDHVHRFNNDERRLLSALASLAAVALQNARLYARVFQSEASLRKNEQLTTLGLLAAEIAHEIRNPLTVIKLLFGYLGLDFPEGDPRRTDVRVIGEKIDQLEAIVSRVLNFAKAPSSLHSRWSIEDIVQDTLVLIRLKLTQSKIDLHYHPPERTLVVDVHKGQLQQVLLNLLINATQAMPEGGSITVNCRVETREQGGEWAIVDVNDTGTGIPDEIRDRIFDSFLSGRSGGTGLGLAIAKRILLSHHGDISLVSTSPAGTTFRLSLPVAKH